VLAVPSLVSAFPQEWEAGGTVTLLGNYLLTANHVAIVGSSDIATIISKDAKQLVITLPATEQGKVKLAVTNSAGTSVTPFSLTNMDKQLKFFTEDFGAGMQDWSWTTDHGVSHDPTFAVASTSSWRQLYTKNGWQGASFHSDNNINVSDYSTLSFYVRGGTEDNTVDVFADAVTAGSGKTVKISVPANAWTFVNIPVVGNFDGVTCQRFDFQVEGNPNADQTLYFDNVLLVH
jgi:hypothetical protein